MVPMFYTAENPWPLEYDPLRIHSKDLNHNNPFKGKQIRVHFDGYTRIEVWTLPVLRLLLPQTGAVPRRSRDPHRLDPGNPPPLQTDTGSAAPPPFRPAKSAS